MSTSIPHESGVYQILCVPTGKVYIGSSIHIATRWRKHRNDLRKGTHYSSYLQHAWEKYGESAFVFSVVEVVTNTDRLFEREQAWIDATHCCDGRYGYNNSPMAGGTRGVRHTEITRQHLSDVHRGRPKSADHVRNQAQSLADDWILIDPNDREFSVTNLLAFCRENQLSAPALCDVASGNRKSYKGWRCVRLRDHDAAIRLEVARAYRFVSPEKNYIVTSPEGQVYRVRGIVAFCKRVGLLAPEMVRVAKGKQRHHAGWRCRYEEPDE